MSQVCGGKTATVLTAELIVDGSRAGNPVISPDGRWVAWTTSGPPGREQPASDLWLARADENEAPVRLAGGDARTRLPRWSPDSGWLFYVAEPGAPNGDAPHAEIRRVRVTAGGPDQDAGTVLRWGGEISGLLPLIGGRVVAVVAGDERTDDDKRREADGDDAMAWSQRAERQHWLWHRLRLLDLDSGELTVVGELAERHVADVAQRPDGGPLAVVSWDCPEFDPGAFTSRLHVVGAGDGAGPPGGPGSAAGGSGSAGGSVTDLGPAGL
ncbi:MAG: PD40 domain-containing protein, partial [Nocardiopsaceae bacterium]|nr:PD40 domain-containing protein [Nocardiopsaceae bacterium]